MVLPAIIGTGLKLFQATRSKASSGSDVASKIISKQTTVSGKSVGKPKSGSIIRSSSSKISGARFLKSTTDPSKDKIKTKEGILQGFVSIINIINKFLSSILTTLIADNKLTQKQFENERRAGELALKRQREIMIFWGNLRILHNKKFSIAWNIDEINLLFNNFNLNIYVQITHKYIFKKS